ncbi:ABC transporter ATP-binding protein [Stappia sp. 28M-7]|uniref:ABC transporter ATP-binding protein n=1 Tax=Stappia sp. 28M-7 TaxID=2762596 RepID=UPI00163BFE67|nr:ABC transporter ATP-binding protein [Stappia sp. 28M-7]MBC2860828.1 ABC transporter ATP-binding protein [Stappia sp. 28M-7]
MSEPVLKVDNLTIDIPMAQGTLHAVRGIDFELKRGETLCIVGESGSGKSLTSLAIMGLLSKKMRCNAAGLNFSGIDLRKQSPRAMRALRGDRMAMIFQEPMTSLNPAYTIGDQLMEALQLHRPVSRAEARARAIELLGKVGITAAESRLSQYPHQLSGGLRQRVMIAMALMCEPELIIADEPTTALDVTIQAQILRLLADLQREMNMAMILVTHDLGVVARIADKVVVMYAGEVVEKGSAREIFENPRHPYTRGLLRCIPVPGKTKPGEHLGSIPGIVPSLIGKVEGCAFRSRCDVAEAVCASEVPVRRTGEDHMYRCIHEVQAGAPS